MALLCCYWADQATEDIIIWCCLGVQVLFWENPRAREYRAWSDSFTMYTLDRMHSCT